MSQKRGKPVTFRPTELNEKRFNYALSLGIDRAEAVNEILELHFKTYLTVKREQFSKMSDDLLKAPVP